MVVVVFSETNIHIVKGNILPYSLLSVGPGADPGVQTGDFKVIFSSRLPLLTARSAVTFPAEERHRPSTGTKLCCFMTDAHRFEQLAQGCYAVSKKYRLQHCLE